MTADINSLIGNLTEVSNYLNMRGISRDYEIRSFVQTWCDTSGGHQGIGGQGFTSHHTIAVIHEDTIYIFFNGRFSYKGNMSHFDLYIRVKEGTVLGIRDWQKQNSLEGEK